MAKSPFQASVQLLSATPLVGNEWEVRISFTDRAGVNTPVNIELQDIIVVDTSPVATGTVATLSVLEIVVSSFTTPTLRVLLNDTFNGTLPDLQWVIGTQGVITRPTRNSNLLPVISPDTQLVSDAVATAITNLNIERLDLELLKGNDINGAIFITNVETQSDLFNTTDKIYSTDGVSLESVNSVTSDLRVYVAAITGHTNYKPNVTVNDLPVLLNETQNQYFTGWVDVTVGLDNLLTARHEDGAMDVCDVVPDVQPVILSSSFISDYPLGQSELKAGDVMSVWFTTDIDVVGYEIQDREAFVFSSGDFAPTTDGVISGLVIADRGNAPTVNGYYLRLKKANGVWTDWFISSDVGFIDGLHTVVLNNLHPTISINAIAYLGGNRAVKNTEAVSVNNSILDYDTVNYTSVDFDVVDPLVFNSNKTFIRLVGSTEYQVTGSNFKITAKRIINGATTVGEGLIRVVNIPATINVLTPQSRLRSGGNGGTSPQSHEITISSNQPLLNAPNLNAPEGTWNGLSFVDTGDGQDWTRTLVIDDSNAKGVFSWNSLLAVGLSGLETTVIASGQNYVLGGFVFRTLTVPAYPNRSVDIGVLTTDVTKLRVSNLSKGASGSLNFTYVNSLDELVDRYTLVDSLGNLSNEGPFWYNNDGLNATSNTTGELTIEIEEVI